MHKHQHRLLVGVLSLAIGLAAYAGGRLGEPVNAQTASASARGPATEGAMTDDLQRSIMIYNYKQVADSGPGRGEELYFYKCWMCHNKYTIAANPGSSAPPLQGLYQRKSAEAIAAITKTGTARMPAFIGSEADLADLLSYMGSEKCCFEGEDPPPNPWYQASIHKWSVPTSVSKGPRGVVRTSVGGGDSAEGIKVQLIAPNGVRTTVYTNADGRYEFPQMQAGAYTLRIATPLEFQPYRREAVRVDGATPLAEIVLERLTKFEPLMYRQISEALPATRDVEAQLSGAEVLWNLPGTLAEKDTFRRGCGSGCHSYDQVFKARYDERGWALIVDRMFNYSAAPLFTRVKGPSGRGSEEDAQIIVKWLAKVRGPESVDPPWHVFLRPRGAATRLVVTEYELPRQLLTAHDVAGDSKGNIWYTSHKTDHFGKLDPRTGIVTEYKTPVVPGSLPGTHRVAVNHKNNDLVWLSENWSGNLTKFDPRTEKFTRFKGPTGNFALAPDGFVWGTSGGDVVKIDPETGAVVQKNSLNGRSTYDNTISADGNFWGGSGPSTGGNYASLLDIRTGKWLFLDAGTRMVSPSRGGFDPFGNAWFGGKNGSLVQIDAKAGRIREHVVPNGYPLSADFYEAMPDKNGEVWGGLLHGRGWVRYNPRTDRWVEYVLPEPYGHNRRTWIDNSTNPVTIWYVDFHGYIVRLQPLE